MTCSKLDRLFPGKEEVTQAFQLDLGLWSESGEVEELTIRSGSEIDALCGRTKGAFQHDGKEDSEQGRRENAALLHSASDVEEVSDVEPSKTTVSFMSSWNELVYL